jgi:hypothetical protein
LAADVVSADKEKLIVDSEMFGERPLAFDSLAGVIVRPPMERSQRDNLIDRLIEATGESDRLLLDNGDELPGLLLGIENDAIKLDTDVGPVEVGLDRVIAIIFTPALRKSATLPPESLQAWVGFQDGSRLLATRVVLEWTSLAVTANGQAWNASADRLVFLQPLGGRMLYLSDLKPAEHQQTPYLDLPWPYQADRNVAGGRLVCGGRLFLKGIGVHSAARLVYRLDALPLLPAAEPAASTAPAVAVNERRRGRTVRSDAQRPGAIVAKDGASPKRFCAEIGVDDSAGGQGSVQFRVLVDGQEKYASPTLRGGSPPMPVSVDLTGAKKLELIIDYADRVDILDYADWLNARIVVR